jgi:hypothetical protein
MTKESTLKPIIIDGLSMRATNINDLFIQPFQEFVYMEEETNKDNPKPSVEVDMKKANKTPENASTLDKVKAWFAKVWRMFTTWLAKIGQNIKDAFSKNYASQIKYVTSNEKLNNEIKDAIANGKFNPTIKDWPKYQIPLDKINTNSNEKNLKSIIEKHLEANESVNSKQIKLEYYPIDGQYIEYSIDEILDSLIQEFDIVLEEDTPKDNKLSETAKHLQNFFLYGECIPTETVTNQLSDGLWTDLVNNIINCEKAITIGITGMQKDISECSKWLDQKFKEVSAQSNDEGETTNNTRNTQSKVTPDLVKSYAEIVQQISNEYLINFANTMQKEFFVKCYNLYRDMVNAYKNTNGEYNVQQTETPTDTSTQTDVQ